MSDYSPEDNRLALKVVFYGPALSGKTTNLMQLHSLLNPQRKGELMVLETRDDRTLFFDMLPIGLRGDSGLDLRLKLYTVPGQVQHDSTRKAVLSRADAVVFVADSQTNQQDNNATAFGNLEDNLDKVGLDIDTLPMAVQFNKRDLPDVVRDAELQQRWANTPWAPLQMASALHGKGVIETFRELLGRLYTEVDREFALGAEHGIDRDTFIRQLSAASEESRA
ncbi:GTP-binding protein [Marinobacter salarius]|uniref:GTP-binding protein n=1 Tax=Marinobacter salarius TaxID=1420917 RepID=UPI0018F24E2E|nr:GTPase domain-containing protein [Marinobacter salarius]MBJ7278406.1 GTPase domain-containing protein [Marinobacter salarius]MDP4530769.1 GTPase domain-containing protein [Marinobacter salarius]|tara:strand:- start:8712 stop:9380 length:669 start_codon:yes stop_codon:yes gene_type:complete